MNLLAAFRRFWYQPTIDAMQAEMLREVRMALLRRRDWKKFYKFTRGKDLVFNYDSQRYEWVSREEIK